MQKLENLQYVTTQKPNTSDDDTSTRTNVYVQNESKTNIHAQNFRHTSYENCTVTKPRQGKLFWSIIGVLTLLLAIFIALFVWAIATKPKADNAVNPTAVSPAAASSAANNTVATNPAAVNLTSYYLGPTDKVSMTYNSTNWNSWSTIESDTCITLTNASWELSISFVNKVALAKFFSSPTCANESYLGSCFVNTGITGHSNVIGVVTGNLNAMYVCGNTTAC
ncbi:hypothetical protein INT43_008352 [Umbelopsis isabellina]|uniref:Uncharacterized protein n=1 Tax=Mortierella isabellina TaxID=91625 RepID=A0A8H7PCZ6_MORIS|nr:hypothetical protein INT43_008352 [Umbelopsis isabellina]